MTNVTVVEGEAPWAERLARVALSRLFEPGHLGLAGLVADLGAAEVLDALLGQTRLPNLSDRLAPRMADLDPERELEQAQRQGIRFVVPGDAEWPAGLDDLEAAEPLQERGGVPLGLWLRGPRRLDAWASSVAIVGSRSSTSYGDQTAADLAAELGRAGHGIVSGAAFGIDLAAHRGALAVDAPTLAVLACGVDRAYPQAHRDLLAHLAREHLVVAESPPGNAPMRARFLARNRIIAALASGTVVVEAAVRSGALNTANWADRLHRPLMGVPGPLSSASSAGVHHLIRRGAATLVTGAGDVRELIGAAGVHLADDPRGADRLRDLASRDQQEVLEAVPVVDPADVASIARTCGRGIVETRTALKHLAGHGLVERCGPKWRLAPAAQT